MYWKVKEKGNVYVFRRDHDEVNISKDSGCEIDSPGPSHTPCSMCWGLLCDPHARSVRQNPYMGFQVYSVKIGNYLVREICLISVARITVWGVLGGGRNLPCNLIHFLLERNATRVQASAAADGLIATCISWGALTWHPCP